MSVFKQLKWSVITLGCLILSTVAVHSQQLQAPSLPTGLPSASPSVPTTPMSPSANTSDDDGSDRTKEETTGNNASQSPNGVLTANQILMIEQSACGCGRVDIWMISI